MNHLMLALLLGAAFIQTGVAQAGTPPSDQTILGNLLLVKNPKPADIGKRKITVKAKEKNSPDTIVGDPTVDGAMAAIVTSGANDTFQVFTLPQGTSAANGKPFWSGDATKGFNYQDPVGNNGPVQKVQIKRSGSGTFSVKILINAKYANIDIVPPNPGDGACAALQLINGSVYSMMFAPGDAQVVNKGDTLFKAFKPTVEGVCFPPETTTTTSTSTTVTSSTSTSVSTTSSTSVPTTTSTTVTTILAGPAFPPVGGTVQFGFSGAAGAAGGADVSVFNFNPTTWTRLYWGPSSSTVPAASLDGSLHVLSTFVGISGGGTVATWEGTSPWTNPGDNMLYIVPIRFTLTLVSPGTLSFVPSTSIPDLDPGPGTGIDVAIDVAPMGTATDFTTNWSFTADLPTDMSGYIPLSNVPTGGGQNQNSFGGGFYSQQ